MRNIGWVVQKVNNFDAFNEKKAKRQKRFANKAYYGTKAEILDYIKDTFNEYVKDKREWELR